MEDLYWRVTVGDNFPVLVGEKFPVSCP